MADIFNTKKRSEIMSNISGKETKPEKSVRSFLFSQGFRFRKNLNTLPGKPDIVLTKYKTIILIHGCFWHGHSCKRASIPKSNTEFWTEKIQSNKERDKKVKTELEKLGWKVLTVWDCELKNIACYERAMNNLVKELNSDYQ